VESTRTTDPHQAGGTQEGKPTMASTTSKTQSPSLDELAEQLRQAQVAFQEAVAAEEAKARAEAMQTVTKVITDASMNLHQAAEAVEAGDTKAVIAGLQAVVDGCREALVGLKGGRRVRTSAGGNGNGTQRGSAIRQEIEAVFADHPGDWFTPSQLAKEMPVTESGKPRSSGAVLNACEGMVAHGQAEEGEGKPRRFRGIQAAE
jgi:hypothetical protein